MMRLALASWLVILGSLAGSAQQNQLGQQPFPTLSPEAKAQLQQVLKRWEQQSQSMKTLECQFNRWSYDNFAAPTNVPASKAAGIIKYASPDKGLFKTDQLVFFGGLDPQGQPIFKPQTNQYGEYWICNGTQLIAFDRSKQECTIQELPENMRGRTLSTDLCHSCSISMPNKSRNATGYVKSLRMIPTSLSLKRGQSCRNSELNTSWYKSHWKKPRISHMLY